MELVQEHLSTLYSLCSVLGLDFKHIASEVHPSYAESEGGSVEILNEKIQHLAATIEKLREVKLQRMQKVTVSMVALSFFLNQLALTPYICFCYTASRSSGHYVGAMAPDGQPSRRAANVSACDL